MRHHLQLAMAALGAVLLAISLLGAAQDGGCSFFTNGAEQLCRDTGGTWGPASSWSPACGQDPATTNGPAAAPGESVCTCPAGKGNWTEGVGCRSCTRAFQNPVIAEDCPDPGVLATNGMFYLTCTGGSMPIRRSRDLVSWEQTGAAILPEGKPSWAANGYRNWAPEIHRVGDSYVAYITTVNGANVLSIGAARASSPTGPYQVEGGPLVEDGLGVIDASFFQDDDGSRWLLYKIDGNSAGQPTPIYIRRLAADGLSFAAGSSPTQILVNDGWSWEGGVVEGPWLIKRDGRYYLFYSGNVYNGSYRTGVARADVLTGPYQKHGGTILANNSRWVGPGHGSVASAGGKDYFIYHAWYNAGDGSADGTRGREVLVDRIRWENGWPAIGNGTPTIDAQPWPGEG